MSACPTGAHPVSSVLPTDGTWLSTGLLAATTLATINKWFPEWAAGFVPTWTTFGDLCALNPDFPPPLEQSDLPVAVLTVIDPEIGVPAYVGKKLSELVTWAAFHLYCTCNDATVIPGDPGVLLGGGAQWTWLGGPPWTVGGTADPMTGGLYSMPVWLTNLLPWSDWGSGTDQRACLSNMNPVIHTTSIPVYITIEQFTAGGTQISPSQQCYFTKTVPDATPLPFNIATIAGCKDPTATQYRLALRTSPATTVVTVTALQMDAHYCAAAAPANTCDATTQCNLLYALSNKLDQMQSLINLIVARVGPQNYVIGNTHTVSGTGTIAVSGILGCSATLLAGGSDTADIFGTPETYKRIGWLRFQDANGWSERHFVTASPMILRELPVDVTAIGYSLYEGVSLEITELEPMLVTSV